jgi:hypothetical protein
MATTFAFSNAAESFLQSDPASIHEPMSIFDIEKIMWHRPPPADPMRDRWGCSIDKEGRRMAPAIRGCRSSSAWLIVIA